MLYTHNEIVSKWKDKLTSNNINEFDVKQNTSHKNVSSELFFHINFENNQWE